MHSLNLKVWYLYDNQLERIENMQCVRQLTHLHLDNNDVREISGLDCLPQLQKLFLSRNCIARIGGLEALANLQELHVADQVGPVESVPAIAPMPR